MVKYSVFALIVLVSVAYVTSAPASSAESLGAGSASISISEDDLIEPGPKKVKRGIFGPGFGYGFGHFPHFYSFYPYGHFGGFGYYPYYSLGFHGFKYGLGHGYFW